ncbi:11231_t:CDS:2 [Diversispora eburnea]|uniref:11231_t:CDS:1 n=3 Tax=Diversisporales TaxID=214509 RepID=A0A9N8ZSU0_9GLOM|nr:11231_t:CDS:2 [Diversispora eburnea]
MKRNRFSYRSRHRADIRTDLKISDIMVNTLLSYFWAQYSDAYGIRRSIYLTSLTLFICASVISALANNILLLIAMRILQACGASCAICVGVGVLNDIFNPNERNFAFGIYFAGYCVGDLLGPVIGGYLDQYLGWRWIYWFLTIYVSLLLLLILIFVPETYYLRPSSSSELPLSRSLLSRSQNKLNLFKPLGLLLYPNIFIITTYISLIITIMFIQNIIIPIPFTITYNLSTYMVGLVYLIAGIGNVLGCVIGGKFSDYILEKSMKKDENGNVETVYEKRINSFWIGGFSIHMVFSSAIAYLVDAYSIHTASIMSVSDSLAFIFSGIMTILTPLIVNLIGYGWMFTILAGANLIGMIFSILVYFKGKNWRERSMQD